MAGWFDWFSRKDKPAFVSFPEEWRDVLRKKVPFYVQLNPGDTVRFEQKLLHFLNTTRITGIQTGINPEDLVLIGASAIIPIFGFPDWEYHNLDEILVYPEHFDEQFAIGSRDKAILGMVGYGYMDGKMVLSKKALHHGFDNSTDKQNTAIHEFVHLIDKLDGAVDGIPVFLMDKAYLLPWLNLIDAKINEINADKSDIRDYGATNRAEFLAVTAEYFFERPALLEKKHPQLYAAMEKLFGQRLSEKGRPSPKKVTRHFDPCPCGSGKKFKDCCMKRA